MALSDFLDNKPAIRTIVRFLAGQEGPALILYGAPGTGKTSLMDCIFKDANIQPLILNVESCQNMKQFRELVENYLFSRTISQLLSKSHHPKVLFLDDFDILVQQDKTLVSYVTNIIERCRLQRNGGQIVLACGRTDEKKFAATLHKSLSSQNHIVRLSEPSEDSLVAFMQAKFPDMEERALRAHISQHFCNVRACVSNMEFLSQQQQNKILGEEDGPSSIGIRPDATFIEAMHSLFTGIDANLTLTSLECLISCDPSLLSYMVYDNYLMFMQQNVGAGRNRHSEQIMHRAVKLVLSAYAMGAMMEASSIGYEALSMQLSFLVRIGTVLQVMKLMKTKLPIHLTHEKAMPSYEFTSVLNKTGLHASSSKRAVRISHHTQDLNRYQILMLFDSARKSSYIKNFVQRNIPSADSAMQYYNQSFANQKKSCVSNKSIIGT